MPEMWRLKAGVQRALAALPFGHHAYRLLQSTVGGLRRPDPHAYVEACREIVQVIGSPKDLATVEVGTGWNVNLPLALHLCGSGSCLTLDASRHCRPREAMRSASALVPALRAHLDEHLSREVERRWAELDGLAFAELMTTARIDYRAPADAASTGLPSGSRDLVFSRAVLQHIPPEPLAGILRETARVLRPGGRVWHRLGLTDQFSLFDRRLSRVHYLTYSEEEWQRLAGNRYGYSNRLRLSDFVALAEEAGFEVEVRNARIDPDAVTFARTGRLHADFAGYDDDDLGTVSADLVGRKP